MNMVKGYSILFATDLEMEAERIFEVYKTRFQIEFLPRNAKQYAGLEHCQGRRTRKLHFHFITSLTSIGIGKIIHQQLKENPIKQPISIYDVTAELSNTNFAERLFSKYGTNPSFYKNKQALKFIRHFAKRVA